MNWKRFLAGAPALIGAPVLVLAVLAAYVYWINSRPQEGPLATTVRPQVVWPWQQVADLMTLRRDVRKASSPSRPVDMVFLVDVSGSMKNSLGPMAEAAYQLASDLSRGQPGRFRFALIRFDTEAQVNTDWTGDPENLRSGLAHLDPFTGGNDTRKAFIRLEELLQRARQEAIKVAVFYTDGDLDACPSCAGREMTEEEMVQAARRLRDRGVDFYSIGLPGRPSPSLMLEMTGAASRVFDSGSTADLARSFRSLGTSVDVGSTSGAVLTNRLDGRHFSAPIARTGWTLGPSGALQLELGTVPVSPTTYWHPLVPLSAGLWRVGLEPPRMTFVDRATGRVLEISADRRPALLVITWLTLLLTFLPAVFWFLANLGGRPRPPVVEEVEPHFPVVRQLPPPSRLPAFSPMAGKNREVVPTLLVGLGTSGLRALLAAREDLKQSHQGEEGWPYRFLWLDLDQREPEDEALFEAWHGYPITRRVAPAEVTRAGSHLPEPGAVPDHLGWFDSEHYQDAAREDLNLADGARGDRALARLALFCWLEQGGLLEVLAEACRDLAAAPAVDGLHQVIVFASRDGGWGSGTFLDFGRLLQRLGRRQQREGTVEIAPEVIGVLCDSPERPREENRKALGLEIESATLAGGFPTRTTYLPSHELLDQVDAETPYHRILLVSEREEDSVAAQCGDLAAILVERRPRLGILETVSRIAAESGGIVPVAVRGVYVTPTLIQEQVRLDLLLRIVGPDVLLDLEASPGGGFETRAVPEEAASRLLFEWAQAEPPGTPLRLLLEATQDPAVVAPMVGVLGRSPSAAGDLLALSFLASVNDRLRGAPGEAGGWSRSWMPGRAVAALRLLGRRIDAFLEGAGAAGVPPEILAGLAGIGDLAQGSAAGLESWITEFRRLCEELARERDRLLNRDRRRQVSRVILEAPESAAQIGTWSRECLEHWLGTPDTLSPLRERLFFTVTTESGQARVGLSSYVGPAHQYERAEAAFSEFVVLTRSLSRLAPVSWIGSALARLPEGRRATIAQSLVYRGSRPLRILLLAPAGEDVVDQVGMPPAFLHAVPQPADHGPREEVASDDPSAVRRVEVLAGESPAAAPSSHLVETAERAAEKVRKNLEEKYSLSVPVLPTELRIALAHPAALRSFAKAYKAGQIVLRTDAAGRRQWFSLPHDRFLTMGSQQDLAAAAANYVWHAVPVALDFDGGEAPGDFSPLHLWARTAGKPSREVLSLATFDLFAS